MVRVDVEGAWELPEAVLQMGTALVLHCSSRKAVAGGFLSEEELRRRLSICVQNKNGPGWVMGAWASGARGVWLETVWFVYKDKSVSVRRESSCSTFSPLLPPPACLPPSLPLPPPSK